MVTEYRLKSWKRQPEYDNLLADMSISSLCFLEHKYRKELKRESGYGLTQDDYRKRRDKEQRYRMICEELEQRLMHLYTNRYRLSVSNWYIDPENVYGYFNEDYTELHGEIIQDKEEYYGNY